MPQKKQQSSSAREIELVTPQEFLGILQTDPDHCYQGEKQGECAARIVQDGIARFYPLIVIATLLQAFAASGTCWLIVRQLNVTKQQLRAYVFVSGAQITNIIEGDGMPKATVLLRNSGQTPAHDVVNVSGVASNKYPPPHTLNLTISDPVFIATARTRQTLGPGDTSISVIIAGSAPTPEQKAAFTDGTGVVYVYGEIRYKDVFGRKQRTGTGI